MLIYLLYTIQYTKMYVTGRVFLAFGQNKEIILEYIKTIFSFLKLNQNWPKNQGMY